jgi:hypothetical protein
MTRTLLFMGAVTAATLTSAPRATAQAVGQADVLIQSLSVTRTRSRPAVVEPVSKLPSPTLQGGTAGLATIAASGLAIQVTVFSHWDDDAQNVRLNVFFPPETHVISMPANCSVPKTAGTFNAFASCMVGTLAVQGSQTLNLTISMPPAHVIPRVGVFAWAETPDPNTTNNHAQQVAP